MNSPIQETANGSRTGSCCRLPWLPLQNLLLAAFVTLAVVGVAEALNVARGFPFGQRGPGGNGWSVDSVPAVSIRMVVCVVALLSARGVAQLLLLPRRQSGTYGYWLLLLNAVLGTLPSISLDLIATHRAHWWRWQDSTWQWEGIALPASAGWLCMNGLALLLATPALIDKRPVRPPAALLPLAVWFALNLVLLAGCVSRASDAAVASLAAPVMVATVLAFQRHRIAVANCGQHQG